MSVKKRGKGKCEKRHLTGREGGSKRGRKEKDHTHTQEGRRGRKTGRAGGRDEPPSPTLQWPARGDGSRQCLPGILTARLPRWAGPWAASLRSAPPEEEGGGEGGGEKSENICSSEVYGGGKIWVSE